MPLWNSLCWLITTCLCRIFNRYGNKSFIDGNKRFIEERHRHRYEVCSIKMQIVRQFSCLRSYLGRGNNCLLCRWTLKWWHALKVLASVSLAKMKQVNAWRYGICPQLATRSFVFFSNCSNCTFMVIFNTIFTLLILQIVELRNHPYFIGVQFHPEFKSRPGKPSPLFSGTLRSCSQILYMFWMFRTCFSCVNCINFVCCELW